MRQVILSVATGLVLATATTMPVSAQQPRSMPPGNMSSTAFTAQITGQVQAVDPSTGVLRMQTVDGPMTVRFPPAAVATVQPGDTVTVAVGLMTPTNPAASPSSRPGMGSGSSTPGYPTTPGTGSGSSTPTYPAPGTGSGSTPGTR